MQKTNTKLWVRFVPLILVLTLVIAACSNGDDDNGGDGPTSNTQPTVTITPTTFAGALPEEGTDGGDETGGDDTGGEDTGGSVGAQQTDPNVSTFTAVGSDTDGDTLEYSWEASDPSVQLSATSGEAITATFTAEGDYTVTVTVDDQSGEANATNSAAANASIAGPGEEPEEPEDPDTGGDGDDTGGNGDEPGAEPTLTSFGVASSESGPFLNDGPSGIEAEGDDGVLTISPGDTFYVQVGASDADGIDSITLQLRNVDTEDTPDGNNNVTPLVQDTEVEGFTLGAPDCTIPTDDETATCVYPVVTSAAADESNLTDGEFAYVFRAQVNTVEIGGFGNRGYVNTATGN